MNFINTSDKNAFFLHGSFKKGNWRDKSDFEK